MTDVTCTRAGSGSRQNMMNIIGRVAPRMNDTAARLVSVNEGTAVQGRKDIMDSKVALVTGASSGIGEATAQRLATAGYNVYGTSRRGARAAQRSFEMLPLDVTSD